MLFATFGAPAPKKSSNPLVIVLGVCGGCVLLVIIGVVVMGVMGANAFKGIYSGAIQTPETTRKFITAIESHDYTAAAAQVEPSAQSVLTADKIKAMEEAVEKKLGPVKPAPVTPGGPTTNTIPGPNGKPQYMEYVYSIPIRYEKGTATAHVHYRSDDISSVNGMQDMSKIRIPGKVTSLKINVESD